MISDYAFTVEEKYLGTLNLFKIVNFIFKLKNCDIYIICCLYNLLFKMYFRF